MGVVGLLHRWHGGAFEAAQARPVGNFFDEASVKKDVKVEAEKVVAYDDVDVKGLDFAEDVGEKGAFTAAKFDLEFILNVLEGGLEIVRKCT